MAYFLKFFRHVSTFFEDIGAGSFTFDPKCFYDPVENRFVVLALEHYDDTAESWITLAISDDSDPNGIWYKYRTWSVVTDGGTDWWVDYPGLGFDQDAIYVTGNLFPLGSGGFGGAPGFGSGGGFGVSSTGFGSGGGFGTSSTGS